MKKSARRAPDESREIYIRLEQYDDIFSDFDVRPFSRRALSSDFLEEIKRAANDKFDGGIDLILHVPGGSRNDAEEAIIAERLKGHFQRHFQILKKKKNKIIRFGLVMVALGIIAMIAATKLIYIDESSNAWLSFLHLFLDPVAIFLLWEGMDQIIFSSKNVEPELDFYRKMSHEEGRISFRSDS
jgi:hypothetical protein